MEDGSREPGEGSSRKPAQAFAGVRQGRERGRGRKGRRERGDCSLGPIPDSVPY